MEYRKRILTGLSAMAGKIHTIILSSEAFFLAQFPQRLAQYFRGFDVEMIVYLRRQDEWANSQYSEFVGGGAIGRIGFEPGKWLEQDKTKFWLSYDVMLDRWLDAIGKDKIKVRLYEKTKFIGGDLLTDFCESVGVIRDEILQVPSLKLRNESTLPVEYLQIMMYFNRLIYKTKDDYLRFVDEVIKTLGKSHHAGSGAKKRKYIFPAPLREKILKDYAQSNAYVAHRFCNKSDGILFQDLTVSSDSDFSANEIDISSTDILRIFEAYLKHSKFRKAFNEANAAKTVAKKTVAKKAEKLRNIKNDRSKFVKAQDLEYANSIMKSLRKKGLAIYSAVGRRFMTPAKQRKLENDPKRFFNDSQRCLNRFIGSVLGF